jgi:hypothetical protein
MPTLFLTKVPKTYNGEKAASSTNVAGKSGYLPAKNSNLIHVYHPILVSTQNRSRTRNSEVSTGRSREYSGSNRYRQGLPQQNPSSSATKRRTEKWDYIKLKSSAQQKKWSLN